MCRYIKFLTAFIFITTLPQCGFAGRFEVAPKMPMDTWITGNDCVARWSSSAKNTYYYCGGNKNTAHDCAGYNYAKNYTNINFYVHNQCISVYDEVKKKTYYYCCCGGTTTTAGRWHEVTKFHSANPQAGLWRWGYTSRDYVVGLKVCDPKDTTCILKNTGNDYTKSKDVAGGTCNQVFYQNACEGETLLTDCDTATSCGTGYAERTTSNGSKRCVLPCEGGKAFKPGTDECIECPTTVTSGIENDECVTCAPNQIYDTTSASCKAKSALTAIANFAYDKCWLCSSNTDLKKCLLQATSQGIGYTPDNSCQLVGTTGE